MIFPKKKISRKWITSTLLVSMCAAPVIAQASVGAISGFVWLDLNGDGAQASNEPAVPNVGISLLDADNSNAVVSNAVSGADGTYQFSGLDFSQYFVRFELPNGCEFTRRNVNNNEYDTLDSDVNGSSGLAAAGRLRSVNPISSHIDAGLLCPDAGITLPTDVNTDSVSIELGVFFTGSFLDNDNLSPEAASLELVSGGLPPGMAFGNGANGFDLGSVFGMPTEAGSFNFAYRVTDAGGTFDTAIATIRVVDTGDDTLGVANDDNYRAEVNLPFSVNLVANDLLNSGLDLSNPRAFVVAGEVPPGLNVQGLSNIEGSGALIGRPTTAGTYSFSYQVRDLLSDRTTNIATVTVVVDETADPVVARNDVALAPGRQSPIDGNLGFGFGFFDNDSFEGLFPSINVVSGSFPKLSLTPGNFSFEYQITSDSGTSNIATATVVVYDRGTARFATDDVPAGTVGMPFSFNVLANDTLPNPGDQVTVVELLNPDLPPGLTFTAEGMLVGTPTVSGNTRLLYQVTTNRGDTSQAIVTVAISEPGSTVTIARDDFITTNTFNSRGAFSRLLENDLLGANVQLIDFVSGTLPPGVILISQAGLSTDVTDFLGGTPNVVGTYIFTYRVVGYDGSSDTATVTVVVE